MKTTKAFCLAASIATFLGLRVAHAGGYIVAWLNEDSCSWISYPAQDKSSRDVRLRPKSLDAKYLRAAKDGLNYWSLDSQTSPIYICHTPKQTAGGGFLELNYLEIYNDIGGAYAHHTLTSSRGRLLLAGLSSQVNSDLLYYPPRGIKLFTSWPGTNLDTLTAVAYWKSGSSDAYATLTIYTRP